MACGAFYRGAAPENRRLPACAPASGRSPRRSVRRSACREAGYLPYPSNDALQVLPRSSLAPADRHCNRFIIGGGDSGGLVASKSTGEGSRTASGS
jgi:hypothetical protein